MGIRHYVPFGYEEINFAAGHYTPSQIKGYNNNAFIFWERVLFQRACSVLKINIPEEWEGTVRDFLYYCLFRNGFITVFELEEFGHLFQPSTLSGLDVFYQPTHSLIENPQFTESLNLEIGEECEILKLTPDFSGIWDIVSYYAEKLALMDCALNMAINNSKFAYLFAARNKAAGEAFKKIFDKVNRGETGVFFDQKIIDDKVDKAEPWQFLERPNLKQSYLVTDLLGDTRTILNNFDEAIGIPTMAYEKKERIYSKEAEMLSFSSTSRAQIWINTFNSSAKLVNAHYEWANLKAELAFDINDMQSDESNGGENDE